MTYAKPLPEADKWSGPFFAACREGRLVAQKCDATGRFFFPPAPVSPFTRDEAWSWQEISPRGRIGSFVVMHQKYFAGFAGEVPYPVIEVELEGGVRLVSNIVDLDGRALAVGMAVEAVFVKATDEVTLPLFRLVD
ncbi:MAG TPA: OB-fold domain-containing protein [Novosphingobium sp.]|nr:OB-fold domain-containing protein [Novosphingobium sp.]HZV09959.1 OB-fold domain-containing protein [Novosphingobium sp.]